MLKNKIVSLVLFCVWITTSCSNPNMLEIINDINLEEEVTKETEYIKTLKLSEEQVKKIDDLNFKYKVLFHEKGLAQLPPNLADTKVIKQMEKARLEFKKFKENGKNDPKRHLNFFSEEEFNSYQKEYLNVLTEAQKQKHFDYWQAKKDELDAMLDKIKKSKKDKKYKLLTPEERMKKTEEMLEKLKTKK